jgi:nitrogen fixation-related uncharacterized protein
VNTFARFLVLVPAAAMLAFIAMFTFAWAPFDIVSSVISVSILVFAFALLVWAITGRGHRDAAAVNSKVGSDAKD